MLLSIGRRKPYYLEGAVIYDGKNQNKICLHGMWYGITEVDGKMSRLPCLEYDG
jgi:hypothetical protein